MTYHAFRTSQMAFRVEMHAKRSSSLLMFHSWGQMSTLRFNFLDIWSLWVNYFQYKYFPCTIWILNPHWCIPYSLYIQWWTLVEENVLRQPQQFTHSDCKRTHSFLNLFHLKSVVISVVYLILKYISYYIHVLRAMSNVCILGSWDTRGLAEPIRLLLEYLELNYEDRRWSRWSCWISSWKSFWWDC